MRDAMLKRLSELLRSALGTGCDFPENVYELQTTWKALQNELRGERCENCQLWDSDPPSAPDAKIPEKTHARVCFGLTLQDVWNGDFMPVRRGPVLTKAEFCCSHFERKELTP
jgi:hypothetical protein